jgi:hypothetical protein
VLNSGLRAVVLAAYSSRNRIMRDVGGRIHVSWGPVTVRMTQREFFVLAELVAEAVDKPVRRGELARHAGGQVIRCTMGQVMLVHDAFTLWFAPREFEGFCGLVERASQQIEDSQSLPALGLPCSDCGCAPSVN